MPDIVLATFNAKYIHPSFGLRCLLANLGPLRDRATLMEFDLRFPPSAAAEKVLAAKPRIVGIGTYIWNVALVRQLAASIRAADPSVVIVLGGPEIGYAPDDEPALRTADYVITGEGEETFRDLCAESLKGHRPTGKRIASEPPDLARLSLPYDLYSDDDIAHKMTYVEATRGCPFECEYCLSSRDRGVRRFPLAGFLAAMERLLSRGARHFKFVDRSFNANGRISLDILDFFLERQTSNLVLHFELVPDRLPPGMLARFRRFAPGTLHFEVGIQSFSPAVNRRIGRVQDSRKAESNVRCLRRETASLIHADLIVGLPGEDMAGFGRGFDRLLRLRPHEIQVNPLKNLPGTRIGRHSRRWGMVFSLNPPYEIIESKSIPRADMERLSRFARFWSLCYNSGRFPSSLPRLLSHGDSPFATFMQFCDGLFVRFGRTHGIALNELAAALFAYLRSIGDDPAAAAAAVRADYEHRSRRETLNLEE